MRRRDWNRAPVPVTSQPAYDDLHPTGLSAWPPLSRCSASGVEDQFGDGFCGGVGDLWQDGHVGVGGENNARMTELVLDYLQVRTGL